MTARSFLLVAWLVLLFAGCREGAPRYPERQSPEGLLQDPGAIARGQQVFNEKCAYCHGHLEEGRSPKANSYVPPPMDFSETRYADVDPAYLFWRIEVGKDVEPFRSQGSVMPAWGPYLSDAEIWEIVAYLRTRAR